MYIENAVFYAKTTILDPRLPDLQGMGLDKRWPSQTYRVKNPGKTPVRVTSRYPKNKVPKASYPG